MTEYENNNKSISIFEDLEKLNNNEEIEYLGRINWLELHPSVGKKIEDEDSRIKFESSKDTRKFAIGDRVVITGGTKDSAVAGAANAVIASVTDKTETTISLSRSIESLGNKYHVYALVWWNVPYQDDLVEKQSRQLAKLEEREQSLALKLSSPEVSRQASSISKKIQTGEISKEDAQQQLGDLALSSGNISPESLSEFNNQTYAIRIQKCETYLGMPSGHLSLLDSLKGLPKQRVLRDFDLLLNPESEESDEIEAKKKEEPELATA